MAWPAPSTTSDPFNAIAEPRRRHILEFIAGDERSVTEIADALELGQPSVSKHLQVLRDVGLVSVRRDGRRTHVSHQRRDTSHDSRLERHVRAALARTAATHQGTRRGGTMTTRQHQSPRRSPSPRRSWSRVAREDVRVADRADGTAERNAGRQAAADGARAAPRRPLVPRPWRRQRPSVGLRAEHQAPVLLEIWGPLFMSTAATSNLLVPVDRESTAARSSLSSTRWSARSPKITGRSSITGWAAHARARPQGRRNRRRIRRDCHDND